MKIDRVEVEVPRYQITLHKPEIKYSETLQEAISEQMESMMIDIMGTKKFEDLFDGSDDSGEMKLHAIIVDALRQTTKMYENKCLLDYQVIIKRRNI
jgi:hypothetical protein